MQLTHGDSLLQICVRGIEAHLRKIQANSPGFLNRAACLWAPATLVFGLFVGVLVPAASAQRYKLVYSADTPEGQFLELIELTDDVSKRIRLLGDFVSRYPQHKSAGWALSELFAYHVQQKEPLAALEIADKLIRIEPDDLDSARLALQCAEQAKSAESIKRWSATVQAIARRLAEFPPVKDPMIAESWDVTAKVASQIVARSEHDLFQRALNAQSPKDRIALLDDFVKQNPASQYLPQVHVTLLQSYRALGNHSAAAQVARKVLASDPDHEDALFVVADASLRAGLSSQALAESGRLITVMEKKPQPAGVREQDWTAKKQLYLGTAHWMRGNVFVNQERFPAADAELRQALPAMRSDANASAAITFYLGWSNYKMERYTEAVRFFKQCLAYNTQYRDQALRNLEVIKNEQGVVPQE
jgi:tetratricopeptide (TPR) repeat protein